MFQKKAWCDEYIIKELVNTGRSNPFTNPTRSKKNFDCLCLPSTANRLCKDTSGKENDIPCNVQPGCTSRVQVVDVTVNKPFKDEVRLLSEDHLDKHSELHVEGNLSASQRRNLITKWVGQIWKKIRKLSVALDSPENAQMSTDSFPNYEMPQKFLEKEFRLVDAE